MAHLKGVVLGVFSDGKGSFELTPAAKEFDTKLQGKLTTSLKATCFSGESKKKIILTFISDEYPFIVVTGLGDSTAGYCPIEEIDLKLENIRVAIHGAIKTCQERGIFEILLDDCEAPKCVGEIAAMSTYQIRKWTSDYKEQKWTFTLLRSDSSISQKYTEGFVMGESQCLAATLTQTPSNLKIPTVYADHIRSLMPPSIECIIRDKEWIKGQNMNLFLGVNQGSVEPAVFIEAHYKGSDKKPIVLIGKGVVFDSGGISLKPSIGMGLMKADMMGSAVVFAVIRAVALLKLPIHVIALSPVTENLPSGSAYKPGDVLTAKNGITVEVDNPDCEGRLAMADTMTYAEIFDPAQVMDFATLTYGTRDSLASLASAVFSRSPQMIEEFKKSAALTGDRVWQMPLYKDFKKLLESHVADILNCTLKRDVSACTAAIFLSQFVKIKEWIHFDLAGVMTNDRPPYPYCPGGTTGRPTRTVVEYLKLQSEKK